MRLSPQIALLAAALFLASAGAGAAQDRRPSGTIILESRSVSPATGVAWEEGRLTFRGRDYPFSIVGLGLADLGVSRAGVRGEVYDLKTPSDFPGTYVTSDAGARIGAGRGSAVMTNAAGVVIRLAGAGQGVRLLPAAEGVRITMGR